MRMFDCLPRNTLSHCDCIRGAFARTNGTASSSLNLSADFHRLTSERQALQIRTDVTRSEAQSVQLQFTEPPIVMESAELNGETFVVPELPARDQPLRMVRPNFLASLAS